MYFGWYARQNSGVFKVYMLTIPDGCSISRGGGRTGRVVIYAIDLLDCGCFANAM